MRNMNSRRHMSLQRIYNTLAYVTEQPARFISSGFIFTILLGAVLLYLPIAQEKPVSWTDCLFIATSAGTVTGLAPIDPGSSFTLFGEIVIVFLIQIGGLGFMTVALMLLSVFGRRISLKQRLLFQESLNLSGPGGTVRLVRNIVLTTLLVEFFGMLILTGALMNTEGYRFGRALYFGFFHSISAFNNAGFALWPDNLMRFEQNTAVVMTISLLLMVGGLGFTTLADMAGKWRWKHYALHTKIMVLSLLFLNGAAWAMMLLFEWIATSGSLHGRPLLEALQITFFQTVTTRTAGFNTVDLTTFTSLSIGLMLVLMYIGAGSASTGSGIKVTTLTVIVADIVSFLQNKKETVIRGRTIETSQIRKAYVVALTSLLFIALICILVIWSNPHLPATRLLFEVVSAFGTVGLSLSVTPELSTVGKYLIMFMMLLGRVGSLTIIFIVTRQVERKIRYPKEKILIG